MINNYKYYIDLREVFHNTNKELSSTVFAQEKEVVSILGRSIARNVKNSLFYKVMDDIKKQLDEILNGLLSVETYRQFKITWDLLFKLVKNKECKLIIYKEY